MKLQIAQAQALLKQEKPNPKKVLKTLKPLEKRKGAPWPVFHYMGVALLQNKEYRTAVDYFLKAINKGSDEAETYHSLSVGFYNLEEYDKAETYAKEALSRRDDFFKAWLNLGSVYRAQARLSEALMCYQKANQLDPRSAGVAFRIGTIYSDQGNISKAEELFGITLQLDANYLEARMEMANIYRKQLRPDDACNSLHKILEKDKRHLGARAMLAEIYKDQAKYGKAVEIYENILSENPKIAGIRVNYALCLQELGQFDESEKNYLQALDDRPDLYEAFSNYLMGLHYNPKRTKEEIFKAHLRWDAQFAPGKKMQRPVPQNKDEQKRLRIGFISGGFRQHPVGWMITKALENLSKEECEIYCYTTNNISDPITKRIHDCSDIWRSVIGYNDEVTAKMIRDDEIDILVELSGHSADNRLKTVALEPAPIIVKWVGGLFNTSGLQSMDYLLSDWQETPAGEEQYYTEKLVRLPDDYICFEPPNYAPGVGNLPSTENGYITFGCFNNPTKVNAHLLEQWAQIMNKVPESRLFLKSKQYETPLFTDRIVEQMEGLGINKERLIFEGQSLHDELLESYNKIDIALDPWPYSGGLSTCEALWMGVPVITLPGPTFAGRHAATHLSNAGMPDLVVDSREEYIDKAVALALDHERLATVRSGLRQKVADSPLCDGKRFGAHLGQAFREMWKQWVKGQQQGIEDWQDHIEVKAISKTNKSKNMKNIHRNGVSGVLNGISSAQQASDTMTETANNGEQNSETYKIETKSDVTICTPADLNVLTSYVLLEQDEWYEPELSFFEEFLKPGMNVVDVGAGFGVYALPMAKSVGKEGRVYAFEPSASTRRFLEMSKLENEFDQLEIISSAISDNIGKGYLDLGHSPELNKLDKNGTEEVQQTTLDAWWEFAGRPDIDVIKLDINGAEPATLLGAEKLLQDTDPLIQVSLGGDAQRHKQLIDLLCCKDYCFFEYVPGSQLLTDFDPETTPDPYLLNIIAIRQEQVEKVRDLGLLFQEEVKAGEPEYGIWKSHLANLPWTAALIPTWNALSISEENESYLRALDYICAAKELSASERKTTCRSEKTALLLQSAQILIRLYNSGDVRIPIAMTLSRVLNELGKSGQALEIIKTLIESGNIENASLIALPFFPPLAYQDNTVINSDIEKWLTVRSVEAWITLKHRTTYLCEELELNLLKALEGNPEICVDIEKRNVLVKVKKGEQPDSAQINRVQKDRKSELNNWFWQSLSGANESEGKELKPIFSRTFWDEQFTRARAEKIINFTSSFNENHFTENLLNRVILETEERLEIEPTDNIAFFIQVHALLSLTDRSANRKNSLELEGALTKKGWTYKSALYSNWFSSVEYRNDVNDPEISAIVISNKFKLKTVENLKKLKSQLDGVGEIIFINNGVADTKFEPLMEYVDTYVKLNGNSGAYLARNLGSVFAKGDLLLFVDDDGIPDEGMVSAHMKTHNERDIIVSRGACYSSNPGKDPWHYDLGDSIKPAITYLEGNTAYKAELFYKAGGWGDYILFGHGGMELSYRLLNIDPDTERQVYIPDARLKHEYFKDKKRQQIKSKKQSDSFLLLEAKHPDLRKTINNWGQSKVEFKIEEGAIDAKSNDIYKSWYKTAAKIIKSNRPERYEKHKLPGELIVSLTSYPARFHNLPLTLLSLYYQSIKPDRIILWIAHEDKKHLTSDIEEFRKNGIEIRFCGDIKSYKKIIPTIQNYPDAYIITADDDLYYSPDWIKRLVDRWERDNSNVVAHRAHRIKFEKDRTLKPYKEWGYEYTEDKQPSALNFPTSGAGVLFPPNIFHKDVTKESLFMKLSPHADDIWLYWMLRLNGAEIKLVDTFRETADWPNLTGEHLWIDNKLHGRNDRQIDRMVNRYGFPELENSYRETAVNSDIFKVSTLRGGYKVKLPDWKTDHIQKFIATHKTPYELDMLKDMGEKVAPGDLVLDIGANIGNHSLYMAALTNCDVIAFEPNKRVSVPFQESIERNNLSSRIKLIEKGVGSKNGTANFNINDITNIGARRLKVSSNGSGEIEIITLDSLDFDRKVKLIKIDVEGMDLEVLLGAKRVINQDKPCIYIEGATHEEFKAIKEFLMPIGYTYRKSFNATPTHLFVPE